MHEVSEENRSTAELLEEIARLRGEVTRLEGKVEELDHLAHRDALLPLANRRGLMRELETLIARHERHATPGAILFIDLDGLKVLNDSFGHAGGDAALLHIAQHLADGTRATDCVARLGGDEFCVLLDHADEQSAIDTADRLVHRIADHEFVFQGFPLTLSVAIGMTLIESGDTVESILARADQAMYRVKAAA
nr:diguanylate cyclase [uncultured Sphingomonas sp.]